MPDHCVMHPRKASIALRFVVVGGSIAGLATAYALRRAGHDVVLLEQSDGKSRSHGGIRSPPNMTRLLNQWGLGPSLAKVGVRCSQYCFKEADTGEILGSIDLLEPFFKELKADFMFIQHDDLHSMLYDLAREAGTDIRCHSKVTKVDLQSISVTVESGETFLADVVIGADGSKSLVRACILTSEITEIPDNYLSLTVTASTELMREDEDLLSLTEGTGWTIWLGDKYFVHGSLIHGNQEFSMMACVPFEGDSSAYGEHWNEHYPLDHFDLDLQHFDPRVRKLLKLAESVTPTMHVARPSLESFVCDRARIGVVGEAAHPMMPNGFHNAAMAIEDAATLGNLFSRINHTDQISRIFAAYEEIRQPRCSRTHELERRRRAFYTAHGPAQKARDVLIRQATAKSLSEWDDEDEKVLKEGWGEELEILSHDASEKVDDWWTKWGALLERESASGIPFSRKLEVSISKVG